MYKDFFNDFIVNIYNKKTMVYSFLRHQKDFLYTVSKFKDRFPQRVCNASYNGLSLRVGEEGLGKMAY
jgi:hypothetical protein